MTRNPIGRYVAMFLCLGFPALAQIDLSGSWASKNHEDQLERGAGVPAGVHSARELVRAVRARGADRIAHDEFRVDYDALSRRARMGWIGP